MGHFSFGYLHSITTNHSKQEEERMKNRRFLAVFLALVMILALTACGGGGNKKAIVGTWKLVDTETETEYGLGIEFGEDGTLRYGLTEDVLEGLAGAEGEDAEDVLAGLDMLLSMEYEIKGDTEMEITMKALFGLAKEKATVAYELNGDTLVFDGATYTRVK